VPPPLLLAADIGIGAEAEASPADPEPDCGGREEDVAVLAASLSLALSPLGSSFSFMLLACTAFNNQRRCCVVVKLLLLGAGDVVPLFSFVPPGLLLSFSASLPFLFPSSNPSKRLFKLHNTCSSSSSSSS
jgi:hypothetical protein